MHSRDILFDVDMDGWAAFCREWEDNADGFEKYFSLSHNVDRVLARNALMAALWEKTNMRILDISAGFCALGMVARHLGHSVTITDVDIPVVRAAQEFLGFSDYLEHEYPSRLGYRFTSLPMDLGAFDLITAIACAPMVWWTKPDWAGFLSDSFCHMVSGGKIILCPNRGDSNYELIELLKLASSEYGFSIEINSRKQIKGITVWRHE